MGQQEQFKIFINDVKNREGFVYDKDFADLFNITSSNLAMYRRSRGIPKSWKKWYCTKYRKSLGELESMLSGEKKEENEVQIQGDLQKEIDQKNDLISYQKKEIKELNNAVDVLRNQEPGSTMWDDLGFDFKADVHLTKVGFLKFERTIKSVTNIKLQSKVLGYSEKELDDMWMVGIQCVYSEHKIEKIISDESRNTLNDIWHKLPMVLDGLKSMIGGKDHYIPVPVNYICKDGSVVSAYTYNKVNWDEGRVIAKVEFLNKKS
tara:strand:- start:133 stop:921 length:789 start_codon:yes stop_codon:yes gene_type:complete